MQPLKKQPILVNYLINLRKKITLLYIVNDMYTKVSSKYIDPSISFCNEARAKMSSGVYIEVNEHANRAQNKIAE